MEVDVVWRVEADGYVVKVVGRQTRDLFDSHHAGNHPADGSQQLAVDNPRAVNISILRMWAKKTAEDMADEARREGYEVIVYEEACEEVT